MEEAGAGCSGRNCSRDHRGKLHTGLLFYRVQDLSPRIGTARGRLWPLSIAQDPRNAPRADLACLWAVWWRRLLRPCLSLKMAQPFFQVDKRKQQKQKRTNPNQPRHFFFFCCRFPPPPPPIVRIWNLVS